MAAIGKIYKGRYYDYEDYLRVISEDAPKRSHLATPMIVNDNVEVRSMTDGKVYTSKSALRSEYKRAGVVEVGNEKITSNANREYKPEGIREDLRQAIARHK